MKYP
jgi:hypothetical protein